MIKIVEDVGAPAAVVAVDMLTLEMAPDYNEIASYVMTGAGYLAGALGMGPVKMQDFLLRMGIASLPLTCRAIRERVKSPMSQRAGASRIAFRSTGRPIQRYPAPAPETPYGGVKLV